MTPEVKAALEFAADLDTDKHSATMKKMYRDVSVLAAALRSSLAEVDRLNAIVERWVGSDCK